VADDPHPGSEATGPALARPMVEWLEHLGSGRRYSPHTLAAYRRHLAHLVELADDVPLERVSQGHVRRYLGQLHAQGLSPRSLARLLASWRGFYQWWAPRVGMPGNPAAGVRGPKAPRGLPKALSVDQTQALLDHTPPVAAEVAGQSAEQRHAVELRDTAMFELFYSSGLRLSELVGLDTAYAREPGYESSSWLDLAEAEVSVLGKGSKRRIVPVGSQACEALRAWLAARPVLAAAAMPMRCSSDCAAAASRPASSRRSWPGEARPRAYPPTSIRTCCGTASPATCCNRPRTCARCRKCWALPASRPPRSIPGWISSIWPRCTTRRIPERAARSLGRRNRAGYFR